MSPVTSYRKTRFRTTRACYPSSPEILNLAPAHVEVRALFLSKMLKASFTTSSVRHAFLSTTKKRDRVLLHLVHVARLAKNFRCLQNLMVFCCRLRNCIWLKGTVGHGQFGLTQIGLRTWANVGQPAMSPRDVVMARGLHPVFEPWDFVPGWRFVSLISRRESERTISGSGQRSRPVERRREEFGVGKILHGCWQLPRIRRCQGLMVLACLNALPHSSTLAKDPLSTCGWKNFGRIMNPTSTGKGNKTRDASRLVQALGNATEAVQKRNDFAKAAQSGRAFKDPDKLESKSRKIPWVRGREHRGSKSLSGAEAEGARPPACGFHGVKRMSATYASQPTS